MFTGIITGVGHIVALDDLGGSPQHGKRLRVSCPAAYLDDVALGDSIALNGACMTVTGCEPEPPVFTVDVSAQSLAKTTGLHHLGPVNLEKALRANDRLGGHLVSGHVDGIGVVSSFSQVGESFLLRIKVPAELRKYLAYKGSLAVHGVSLTVNHVQDEPGQSAGCEVSINLIPHTVMHTALCHLRVGAAVNLEIDLIARYVARMLSADEKAAALGAA
jgi:riboflavin synthase